MEPEQEGHTTIVKSAVLDYSPKLELSAVTIVCFN